LFSDIKNHGLHKFVRKIAPDDLEAQVKALKDLQQQPAFVEGRRLNNLRKKRRTKSNWFKTVFSFFRRK